MAERRHSKIAAFVLWSFVAALLVPLSVLAHLAFPATRRVAARTTERLLDGLVQGELRIGRITHLDLRGIEADYIDVFDSQHRKVVSAHHLSARWDLSALWTDGNIHILSAEIDHASLRWIGVDERSALPTFVTAFFPKTPSGTPSTRPVPLRIDHIALHDVAARGSVPGFENFVVEHLRTRAHVDTDATDVLIHFDEAHGTMVKPLDYPVQLTPVRGLIRAGHGSGLEFFARATTTSGDALDAHVRTRSLPDRPTRLDLDVDIASISVEALRGAHIPIPMSVVGHARGQAQLAGIMDALELRADITHEAGAVHAEGTLAPNTFNLQLFTDRIKLEEVLTNVPPLWFSGNITLNVPLPVTGENRPEIRAEIDPSIIAPWRLPAFTARAILQPNATDIAEMVIEDPAGRVIGNGTVGFDGAIDVRVDTRGLQLEREPNVRRLAPSLRGNIATAFRLRLARGQIDLNGRATVRRIVLGSVTAQELTVEGRASGAVARPVVHANVELRGTVISGYEIERVNVRADGGPAHFVVDTNAALTTGEVVRAQGTIDRKGSEFRWNVPDLAIETHGGEWHGQLHDLIFDPNIGVSLERFVVSHEASRVELHGHYSFDAESEIDGQIQGLDAQVFRPWLPESMQEMVGMLDLHATYRAEKKQPPTFRLEGALRDARLRDLEGIQAVFDVSYDPDSVGVDGFVDFGDHGNITMSGTGQLNENASIGDALTNGQYDLGAQFNGLDLALLPKLLPTVPQTYGQLDGALTVRGDLHAPEITLTLDAARARVDATPALDLHLDARTDSASLVTALRVRDGAVVYTDIQLSGQGNWLNSIANADKPTQVFEQLPWHLEVQVPQRLMQELPKQYHGPLRDIPLQFLASMWLEGGPRGFAGELRASAKWIGSFAASTCASDAAPRAALVVALENDVLTTDLTSELRQGVPMLTAHATLPFALGAIVHDAALPAERPRINGDVTLATTQLDEVPIACERATGPIAGEAFFRDLFTATPAAQVRLRAEALSVLGGPRIQGELSARANTRAIVVDATMHEPDTEANAALQMTMEATWPATSLLPSIEPTARFLVLGQFEQSHIAPLLLFAPGISQADAILDGRLQAQGTRDALTWAGDLSLTEGRVELTGPGQRLDEVDARIHFEESHAEIQNLRAQDGDGSVEVHGRVNFTGIMPDSVELDVEADEFPVRREGTVLARMTGAANLTAAITRERAETRVHIRTLDINLPDEASGSVQDLDPHPDVHVIGERRRDEARASAYPFHIVIDAQQPFWVRRKDFAAQVDAELDIRYETPDMHLAGFIHIQRGFFEIFGKRFALSRGSINFDGGTELDPVVDISAVYELSASKTVTVTVSGRLDDPHIDFTSTESSDRGEIIALLLSGRTSITDSTNSANGASAAASAQERATSFLAALTAGILTVGLRRELGDFAPVIQIDASDSGARARIGFQADEFIRTHLPLLAQVVQGAYFEGFVSTQSNNQTSQATGTANSAGGFLIELRFPYSIVQTTTFRAPSNFGLDVTWEP